MNFYMYIMKQILTWWLEKETPSDHWSYKTTLLQELSFGGIV